MPSGGTMASLQPQPTLTASVLAAVPCVFVLTTPNSTRYPLLRDEVLVPYGLMARAEILVDLHPGSSKDAVWRAHARAWNRSLTLGCAHSLIFEDDATFVDRSTALTSLQQAQAFLRSGTTYDVLFLGWQGSPSFRATPRRCIFQMSGFAATHAMIVSRAAAELYSAAPHNLPIDTTIAWEYDRQRFFTVLPSIALQRFHVSTNGNRMHYNLSVAFDKYWSQPNFWARWEAGLYSQDHRNQNFTSGCVSSHLPSLSPTEEEIIGAMVGPHRSLERALAVKPVMAAVGDRAIEVGH